MTNEKKKTRHNENEKHDTQVPDESEGTVIQRRTQLLLPQFFKVFTCKKKKEDYLLEKILCFFFAYSIEMMIIIII